VTAPEDAVARIRHGNAVNLPEVSRSRYVKVFHGQTELIAIAQRIAGTLFQPKVVMVGEASSAAIEAG
jgi:tRNA pseudouridine55 synthase